MSKRWHVPLLLGVWFGASGAAHATVTETPDPVNVGGVVVGESGVGTAMLSDTTASTVTFVPGSEPTCDQFQLSPTSLMINGTPKPVTVTFTPTSAGVKTCTITVTGGSTAKTFRVQ